jgi:hypothetical protein
MKSLHRGMNARHRPSCGDPDTQVTRDPSVPEPFNLDLVDGAGRSWDLSTLRVVEVAAYERVVGLVPQRGYDALGHLQCLPLVHSRHSGSFETARMCRLRAGSGRSAPARASPAVGTVQIGQDERMDEASQRAFDVEIRLRSLATDILEHEGCEGCRINAAQALEFVETGACNAVPESRVGRSLRRSLTIEETGLRQLIGAW